MFTYLYSASVCRKTRPKVWLLPAKYCNVKKPNIQGGRKQWAPAEYKRVCIISVYTQPALEMRIYRQKISVLIRLTDDAVKVRQRTVGAKTRDKKRILVCSRANACDKICGWRLRSSHRTISWLHVRNEWTSFWETFATSWRMQSIAYNKLFQY